MSANMKWLPTFFPFLFQVSPQICDFGFIIVDLVGMEGGNLSFNLKRRERALVPEVLICFFYTYFLYIWLFVFSPLKRSNGPWADPRHQVRWSLELKRSRQRISVRLDFLFFSFQKVLWLDALFLPLGLSILFSFSGEIKIEHPLYTLLCRSFSLTPSRRKLLLVLFYLYKSEFHDRSLVDPAAIR